MYFKIVLLIGIWILAGITVHIWYRRVYTQQGEKLFFYRAQLSRWEKEGYDVSIQRNKIEWLIKEWERKDKEKKLFKLLRRILRWSPSVGQDRGLIKRGSCHSYSVYYQAFYHIGTSILHGAGVHFRWCPITQ